MKRRFILSVDGGGIRCIIAALILVELERRIHASGRKGRLDQYFHMFAGSGIGSVLMAALAYISVSRPGDAVSDPFDIVQFFHQADLLFANRVQSASGLMIHESSTFEDFLKNWFGSRTLVSDARTHVVFPAFELSKRAPIILSDLDPVTSKFYLWQALRGVCAVPRFLTPALVENRADARARGTPLIPIVGGGRYADDPSLAAYLQARKLGWNEGGMTMLSIGTGVDRSPIPYFGTQGNHGLGMTDVTESLLSLADDLHCPIANNVNMLMNGDAKSFNGVATRLTSESRGRLTYFRINGTLQKASEAPSDTSAENLHHLQADAARFIDENAAVLEEIVNRLPPEPEQEPVLPPAGATLSAPNLAVSV